MTYQPDDLHRFDAQQAAQDAFPPPLTLADLSAAEKEALASMNAPADGQAYIRYVSWARFKRYERGTALLLAKGLIQVTNVSGFHALTPDGLRLQAELFADGGAE